MYLKTSKKPDGRIHMSFVRSVHVPGKTPRTVTVKSLGYDVDYLHLYDDPVAHFREEAKRLTLEENRYAKLELELDLLDKLLPNEVTRKNLGIVIASYLYHELQVDQYVRNRQRYRKFEYDANAILKLLVYGRLLFPGSKKQTWERRYEFFEDLDCSLDDVYRCLSFFAEIAPDLPEYLHKQILRTSGRNTEVVYYDVTNYYFEIDREDELRKKGYSKENRRSPIIQMGLFMDADGLPILYNLYPGNTSDSLTLRQVTKEIRTRFDMKKVVVVADRGVISGDNIYDLLSCRYGYVFSYSITKAGQDFQKFVLDPSDYRTTHEQEHLDAEGNRQTAPLFQVKSRRSPREIWVTTNEPAKRKAKRIVHEKQVVYWSAKYAKRTREKREKLIEKALGYIKDPASYEKVTSHGAAKYILNFKVDANGEIHDDVRDILVLDQDTIDEESRLDGYFAIVTSEMERSDEDIIDIYHGLWQIEQHFRISKSELETRPVYVSREDRIQAHFLTCYLALLILKLIQKRAAPQLSTQKILHAMQSCCGSHLTDNYYLFDSADDELLCIGDKFDIDFRMKYRRLGEIRSLFAKSKK